MENALEPFAYDVHKFFGILDTSPDPHDHATINTYYHPLLGRTTPLVLTSYVNAPFQEGIFEVESTVSRLSVISGVHCFLCC